MPYYIKVTPEVKRQILPDYVNKPKSADGNYLLFQSDLIGVEGNTLQDRVDRVGGALLTPAERKAEGLGTANPPAECYTPKAYGGKDKTDTTETSTNVQQSSKETTETVVPEVVTPVVTAESSTTEQAEDEASSETKEESEVKDE